MEDKIFEIVEGDEETEVALMNTIAEADRAINFATVIKEGAKRLLEKKFPQKPIEDDIAELQEELELNFALLKMFNGQPEKFQTDRIRVLQDIADLRLRLAEMGQ